MMGQKEFAALVAAALLGAGGCEMAKPGLRQDVEFMRGCWVWKEPVTGKVLGFLRLLPPGADAKTYDGEVQIVSGPEPEARSRFSFARDGASATWTAAFDRVPSGTYLGRAPDEPPPPNVHVAVFQQPGDLGAILQVEGGDDKLSIFATDLRTDRSFLEFEGERDGCD
jgi:hypothetical protein